MIGYQRTSMEDQTAANHGGSSAQQHAVGESGDPSNNSSSSDPASGSQQPPAPGSAVSPMAVEAQPNPNSQPQASPNPLPVVHPPPTSTARPPPHSHAQNGGPLGSSSQPIPEATTPRSIFPRPPPLDPRAQGGGGQGHEGSTLVTGSGMAGRSGAAGGVGGYGVLAPTRETSTGLNSGEGGGSAAARMLPGKRPRVEPPPAKRNALYNKRCVKCNGTEPESRRRVKLCKDNPLCRRWVHRGEIKGFNVGVVDRTATCCVHRTISNCECLK